MEHLVLKVLSFDLAAPTINQFLSQYFLHYAVNKRVESLAMVRGPPPPGAGGWFCKPVRSTPGWSSVVVAGGRGSVGPSLKASAAALRLDWFNILCVLCFTLSRVRAAL